MAGFDILVCVILQIFYGDTTTYRNRFFLPAGKSARIFC